MIITGYHGTSKENAENIIRNGFWESKSDTEWLGDGIYFFPNYIDATNRCKEKEYHSGAIVHAIIKVAEDEILDLNKKENYKDLNRLYTAINDSGLIVKGLREKNQCIFCNKISKGYKLLVGDFSRYELMIEIGDKRKEFCVKDKNILKSLSVLEVIYD